MPEIGVLTWVVTVAIVVALLGLDLAVAAARPHRVGFEEATAWSLFFALDSIPAIFGITQEPYIVFAANALALLGLRALYFLVKGLLDRLVYLSTGLAIILAFIGVKLILHWAHEDLSTAVPKITTPVSLGVIVVVLAVVSHSWCPIADARGQRW